MARERGVRGGQGIRSGEFAIREQNTAIGTTEHGFTDDFGCTAGAHGQQRYFAAGESVFEHQCLFQGVEVFRVEDSGQGGPVYGAVGFHGVFTHIAGIGHLFGQHDDFQRFLHY